MWILSMWLKVSTLLCLQPHPAYLQFVLQCRVANTNTLRCNTMSQHFAYDPQQLCSRLKSTQHSVLPPLLFRNQCCCPMSLCTTVDASDVVKHHTRLFRCRYTPHWTFPMSLYTTLDVSDVVIHHIGCFR